MADLTIQTIAAAGLDPAYSAVSATDKLKADSGERHFLHVKNGGGVSTTVTITAQKTTARVGGAGSVTISNMSVAIPAGEERLIGPFPEAYLDTAGDVNIAYSATTSVTAAAFTLPRQ